MKSTELISTTQAAERLGITRQRVFDLIESGRLPAFKIGRSYAINESDLELVSERKVGRPPKAEKAATKTSKTTKQKANKK